VLLLLHVRRLLLDLDAGSDALSGNDADRVHVNDCINLSTRGSCPFPHLFFHRADNSDLLACTVIDKDGNRQSRFLVTDQLQLILVEPDAKRLGWAVVRFEGLLQVPSLSRVILFPSPVQDTQLTGDPSDSRMLHVIVEDAACRSHNGTPLLSARFQFDDHIRCMAAKQRLSKAIANTSRITVMNIV
jgi:protein CLEC16A